MKKNEWTKWKESSEKESLIKVLKQANAEKDIIIDQQASQIVSLSHQIVECDKVFNEISKMIGGCEDE